MDSDDRILAAASEGDYAALRELFREYAAWLKVDYCLKDFDAELAQLPVIHAAPAGGLWLARIEGEPAGCVAVRPLAEGLCEMRRLWVRDRYRGAKLGRGLAEAALAGARAAGHKEMSLETVDDMAAAHRLYASLGFREAAGDDDLPGNVRRLVCDLTAPAPV